MDRASEPRRTPWERYVAVQETEQADAPTVFEIGIPMRDGVELAADVYLPPASALPVPAVMQSTPYDKTGGPFFGGEPAFYQSHGYAFVLHDVRGRGKSEGEWRAMANDGRDGHDVIEWVAAQDWCTGRVGSTGLSYMGWTQWAQAAERPPHLRAMVSTSAAGRWQQEIPYTNGCFQLYFGWWVYMVRRRIQESHGLGLTDWDEVLRRLPLNAIRDFIQPVPGLWEDVAERETLDDYWRALRIDDRYAGIDVPCLHVTGWYDLEDLLGAFHHYEQMIAKSPASQRQRLLVGPWSHVKSRFPHHTYADQEHGAAAAPDMNEIHLRWFDHWLKDEPNGVPDDPPVRLFEPGTNVWREAGSWPLAQRSASLFLRSELGSGGLSATQVPDDPPQEAAQGPSRGAPGGEPPRSYRYDPLDPAPTQLDVRRYPLEDVPLDQTAVEGRPDVLTYTSAPLERELVISGWPHLHLRAATDGDDTDWHVKLTDVDEAGISRKVTQGCLRAACRSSLERPSPVTPGAALDYDIELWPTHHAFLPGHRLRVSVTSSDFPWFARHLNRFHAIASAADPRVALNTVLHPAGARGSHLELPIERGELPR
ncbi:MAG: CocE/NonD family hydrolase [Candidatus Dormiibacterota bacterium]